MINFSALTNMSGKEIRIHPGDFHIFEELLADKSLNTFENKLNHVLCLRDVPVIADFNISRGHIMLLDLDKIRKNCLAFRWYVFEQGGGI